MKFEDVMITNKLEVGKEAYLDFKYGTYLGVDEEGYHTLEYLEGDLLKIKKTKYAPTVPHLPLGLYFKKKSTGQFCELIDYKNFNDKMFYVIREYANVFKDEENETLHDLINGYELLEGNPFVNYDIIEMRVEEYDVKLNELESLISELKKDVESTKEKRKEATLYCKHEWEKDEAEEIANRLYEQFCKCVNCGEEKINRFSRW